MKPLLSAKLETFDQLKLPVLGSPKLDGIRCLIKDSIPVSRNLRPIDNEYIRKMLSHSFLEGLDGELIVGKAVGPGVYNRTNSAVRSRDGRPAFTFFVFDMWNVPFSFRERLGMAKRLADRFYAKLGEELIVPVAHDSLFSLAQVEKYEQRQLKLGYEGVMFRSPDGHYKFGRSTLREGILMKFKRFRDGEARITGIEESNENTNELEQDALGYAKRSTKKEGLRGKGMVGAILTVDLETKKPMRLAPGKMNHAQRKYYFEHPSELVGQTAHYRVFDYGAKDMPRFPQFYGIRTDL